MNIGIIGAGNIGTALAVHFRKLQHTVKIANSRGPDTLSQVAQETGAKPATLLAAASGVDLLVITIPMKSVPALPHDLLAKLPATSPIIDTVNYYPLRDGVISEMKDGVVESEWTSRILGRRVIKVFNNITADSLLHKALPKGSKKRIALPVSGDDATAKARCDGSRRSDRLRRHRCGPSLRILALSAWDAGVLPRSNQPAASILVATSQPGESPCKSRSGGKDDGKTSR
jgi:predicted dinucleotide-binding enzyme